MKNKKILVSIVFFPLLMLTFSTFASDDFDCTTLDKDEMAEIKEKIDAWEDLTDDEAVIAENAQTCAWPQWWMWGWANGEMWEDWEGKWNPDLEKGEMQRDQSESVTEWKTTSKRVVWTLSTTTKASISSAMKKVDKAFLSLSNEEKIEKLEAIMERLEDKLEIILDNDDFSDEKKELFESIINELLNQLDDKINLLEEVDD